MQEKEKHLEDRDILQSLKSKLEEARDEGIVIAEKCSKMKRIQESELECFINQLIRIQNHRLRNIQKKLCSCNMLRHYPEDSQIEISFLMEELIKILEDSQLKTVEDERPRRSYSREPSQYSSYSKNNAKSFKTIKETSPSLPNCFLTDLIKSENFKSSMDRFSKHTDSVTYEDFLRPTKEFNFKKMTNTNAVCDDQDVTASVRKWLQLQKLSDSKRTNKHQMQDEQIAFTPAEKQKSVELSVSQWKNAEYRKCPTKFCSAESFCYAHNACGSQSARSANSLTHFLNHRPEEGARSSVEDHIISRRNLLEKTDLKPDNSKTPEKNAFGRRAPSFLKSYNERKLDSVDNFVNDLEHSQRTDRQFTEYD